MTRTSKIHLAGAVYCAVIVVLNRYDIVHYSRTIGLIQSGSAPLLFAYAIGWMTVLCLGAACIYSAERILSLGFRLRSGEWMPCRLVFLYALPLIFVRGTTSVWVEPDGATATRTSGYGSVGSNLFMLTVLALILLQILVRLRSDKEGPNQLSEPTLASGTAPAGQDPRHR